MSAKQVEPDTVSGSGNDASTSMCLEHQHKVYLQSTKQYNGSGDSGGVFPSHKCIATTCVPYYNVAYGRHRCWVLTSGRAEPRRQQLFRRVGAGREQHRTQATNRLDEQVWPRPGQPACPRLTAPQAWTRHLYAMFMHAGLRITGAVCMQLVSKTGGPSCHNGICHLCNMALLRP